jgi:hypothetical protein
VTTGETSDAVIVEFLVERRIGLADSAVEDVTKGGHTNL